MFKAIIENTSDLVVLSTPTAEGIYLNPAGFALLGHPGASITEINLQNALPPAMIEKAMTEILPTVMQKGSWTGESAMLHADGTVIPVSQVTLLIRDARGEPVAMGTIARDIREFKRIETELRRRHAAQQETIHAMSTPIIQIWDNILTLPVVGLVDSVRAADMKDALLSIVASSHARFAIIDLTGVDTVDTATADHLLQIMRAVTLLGACGVVTGIQPGVAQILVSLGVEMGEVITLRSLREGLRYCLRRLGYQVIKPQPLLSLPRVLQHVPGELRREARGLVRRPAERSPARGRRPPRRASPARNCRPRVRRSRHGHSLGGPARR